ncbi:MAG: transcriptional regulator [Ammonifex sp.]|nr:MAG: transcriptional regulator [Ammonifex sp.]
MPQHLQDEVRTNLFNRLKRIEGQVRGMTRMVAEDQDCEKILDQFKALNAAVRNCGKVLVGYYVMQCVEGKTDCDEETLACIRQNLSTIISRYL